jgi:hypothetical protein
VVVYALVALVIGQVLLLERMGIQLTGGAARRPTR